MKRKRRKKQMETPERGKIVREETESRKRKVRKEQ